MPVFLSFLDHALTELFELSAPRAMDELEREMVYAILFQDEIRVPDVFLFNNPTLSTHILNGRDHRSLFAEALAHGVIKVYRRRPNSVDFASTLDVVRSDTLAGIRIMRHALAIQDHADSVAERLDDIVDDKAFVDIPMITRISSGVPRPELTSGESLYERTSSYFGAASSRTGALSMRTTHMMQRAIDRATEMTSEVPRAGLRRAALITALAETFDPDLLSEPRYLFEPYSALLDKTPSYSNERYELRRSLIAVCALYHTNMADNLGARLLWPTVRASSDYVWAPEHLKRILKRLGHTEPAYVDIKLPPLGTLKALGYHLVELRSYGTRYFTLLRRLRRGESVSIENVQEVLNDYALRLSGAVPVGHRWRRRLQFVGTSLSGGGSVVPSLTPLGASLVSISMVKGRGRPFSVPSEPVTIAAHQQGRVQ